MGDMPNHFKEDHNAKGVVYGNSSIQTDTPVITQTRVDPPTETRTITPHSGSAADTQSCAAEGTTNPGLAADSPTTQEGTDQCGNDTFYDGGQLTQNYNSTNQASGESLDGLKNAIPFDPAWMEIDPTATRDTRAIMDGADITEGLSPAQ